MVDSFRSFGQWLLAFRAARELKKPIDRVVPSNFEFYAHTEHSNRIERSIMHKWAPPPDPDFAACRSGKAAWAKKASEAYNRAIARATPRKVLN